MTLQRKVLKRSPMIPLARHRSCCSTAPVIASESRSSAIQSVLRRTSRVRSPGKPGTCVTRVHPTSPSNFRFHRSN